MSEKALVFRVANNLFSVPFGRVDEIINTNRVMSAADLPDDPLLRREAFPSWVATRGRFVPLSGLLPMGELSPKNQILVLKDEHGAVALAADQVYGIEPIGDAQPFPQPAVPCCRIPYAAVRVWNGRIVLELDLSRLISLH